jgi:PAS domain S-box-containing protein
MDLELAPIVVPLIVAGLASAALAFYSWRHRNMPGASGFVMITTSLTVWLLTYAVELLVPDRAGKIFWTKATYLGVVTVVPALVVFVLQYTGRDRWLTRPVQALMILEAMVVMLFVLTNETHGLIWPSAEIVRHDLKLEWGPVFWVHVVYTYVLSLIALAVMARQAQRTTGVYRRQALAMAGAELLPWMGNALHIFNLNPLAPYDLTPLSFTVSVGVLAWALFRFRLLDVVPVAREAVIESMNDGILVLDRLGHVVDLNPAACAIIGAAPPAVIGRFANEVLHDWPDLVERYRTVTDAQTEICKGEGPNARHYDLRISPLRDRRGRVGGRLIFMRDITERKRAEEELRTATEEIRVFNEHLEYVVQQRTEELNQAFGILQRLDQTKSDFIQVAAHELRTPLTVIRGYTQLLRSRPALLADAEAAASLTGILSGADRLHQVVNSMLDVARIDAQALRLKVDRTLLSSVINRALDYFGTALEERRLCVEITGVEDLPPIQADPELLYKVFYHLVMNAIKYTPDGGRISVSSALAQDGAAIEVVVGDTGIGIDHEHFQLIFEKFYQMGEASMHSSGQTIYKGGGPGLGLAIARGIVQAHGGQIWVESPGHDEERFPGSRFHVILPIVALVRHAGQLTT